VGVALVDMSTLELVLTSTVRSVSSCTVSVVLLATSVTVVSVLLMMTVLCVITVMPLRITRRAVHLSNQAELSSPRRAHYRD